MGDAAEDAESDAEHCDDLRPAGRRSSGEGLRFGGGGGALDFIDEVSEGIYSYLGILDERQRGVVYDRHDKAEGARWRQCIQRILAEAAAARAGGGRRELPRRPQCPPPRDLAFHSPVSAQDGRPRLQFSSCFESGNLAIARSDTPTQYTLLLDFDVNTAGYTQWFYFAVRGGFRGMRVTFCIANMSKPGSLFAQGMRPVVWSERCGRGWERGCGGVQYRPSEHKSKPGERAAKYHSLEFSYTFEHKDDTVFFAYHYPYTYTYLQEFLAELQANPYTARFLQRGMLCKTIAGLECDVLDIVEPGDDAEQRPLAVVTARVHPGESNSSWMAQGFLRFLCSSAPQARLLRQLCNWVVVPMLNPDGVIHGNYRCGLAGADLNRTFLSPHQRLHPTVWHLKERLRGNRVDLYLDFHGHSKHEGVFFYGGRFGGDDERNAHIRLLPSLCAIGNEDFAYNRCAFSVQESKLTTARLVAFMQMNVVHAYTVEASFSSSGPRGAGCPEEAKEEHEEDEEHEEHVEREEHEEHEGWEEHEEDKEEDVEPASPLLPADGAERRPPATRPGSRQGMGAHHRSSSKAGRAGDSSPDRVSFSSSDSEDGRSHSPGQRRSWDPGKGALDLQAAPPCEASDFQPARLELVGPTIGRALAAAWELAWGVQQPAPEIAPSHGLLAGGEARAWRHLRYGRLTAERARKELAKLLRSPGRDEANDSLSDSMPSADEKTPEELKKIHQRILSKLRRRRRLAEPKPAPSDPEPVEYRMVVAFGKSVRVPVRRSSGEAEELPVQCRHKLQAVVRSIVYMRPRRKPGLRACQPLRTAKSGHGEQSRDQRCALVLPDTAQERQAASAEPQEERPHERLHLPADPEALVPTSCELPCSPAGTHRPAHSEQAAEVPSLAAWPEEPGAGLEECRTGPEPRRKAEAECPRRSSTGQLRRPLSSNARVQRRASAPEQDSEESPKRWLLDGHVEWQPAPTRLVQLPPEAQGGLRLVSRPARPKSVAGPRQEIVPRCPDSALNRTERGACRAASVNSQLPARAAPCIVNVRFAGELEPKTPERIWRPVRTRDPRILASPSVSGDEDLRSPRVSRPSSPALAPRTPLWQEPLSAPGIARDLLAMGPRPSLDDRKLVRRPRTSPQT
mmetsp:Transcript_99000/g.280392  ORF Transcript_99000/g.280392 Transcript_99000/m.280392 type:complete len:1133 (-) Transcript_99000:326-3724(-)